MILLIVFAPVRGSFTGELGRALSRHPVDRVVVTEPGEWRVWDLMRTWGTAFGILVEMREDDRFQITFMKNILKNLCHKN